MQHGPPGPKEVNTEDLISIGDRVPGLGHELNLRP